MKENMKELFSDIKYVADKGGNRGYIVRRLTEYEYQGKYTEKEINDAIDEMIKKNILAEGHKNSSKFSRYIVVIEWMPNTAAEMRKEIKEWKGDLKHENNSFN